MTDPKQEYQSLDELFRKTFDNLPDAPAPSGWDTPSERVWHHVERNIQPPKSGWTLKAIGLVSAFAVTLAVGLYLYMARPAAQQDAAQPAPTAAPAAETPTNNTQPTGSEPSPAEALPTTTAKQPTKPQPDKPKQSAPAAANSAEENAADAKRPSSPTAAPLPGTKPASPNSTERQRSEGGKKDDKEQ